MPFGLKPACVKCSTKVSDIWHKTGEGNVTCNDCFLTKSASLTRTELPAKLEKPPTSPEAKVVDEDQNNEATEVDESIADEPVDDTKLSKEFGLGTRSGNVSTTSLRGGRTGTKKTRGRSKKLGNTGKVAVGKGRGRRSVFKKQVIHKSEALHFHSVCFIDLFP